MGHFEKIQFQQRLKASVLWRPAAVWDNGGPQKGYTLELEAPHLLVLGPGSPEVSAGADPKGSSGLARSSVKYLGPQPPGFGSVTTLGVP